MELLKELWEFMRVRKKFWLAPIIITLLILSAMFFAAQISGLASPFLYAL